MAGKARSYLKRVGLGLVMYNLRRDWRKLRRRLSGKDKRRMAGYLAGAGAKKLNLGCGENILKGWLNVDFDPVSKEVVNLDATERFPLPDRVFDFVFSEHMIEHVSYAQAEHMLRECFRVMKAGGRIRISTPDFKFLVELYRGDKSPLQEEYVRRAAEEPGVKALDTHVINRFVREWGHQFIYDEKALRIAMEAAGFAEIERCELNQSRSPELRNIENESRRPAGFLRLETLTLEGVKRG
ncbi:MAG: methyltransferase domain-containing protein [Terracidiphilus sp.]